MAGTFFGDLTTEQALAEADRGVADASRGTTNEMVLAAAYREALRGNNQAAAALFRTASLLMPRDRLIALSGISGPAGLTSTVPALRDFIAKKKGSMPDAFT